MNNTYLYPYKMSSKSCKSLVEELNITRIRHEGSRFKGASTKTVINWGSTNPSHQVMQCGTVLNDPNFVQVVINKLEFFKSQTIQLTSSLNESISHEAFPRLVPWTDNKDLANQWLLEGQTVIVRNVLTGHSGSGIMVVSPGEDTTGVGDELPDAPLYTKYIPKDSEYRIHCMKFQSGLEAVYRQRKIKDPRVDQPVTWKIRSHQNGFIFQHHNSYGSEPLNVPEDVLKQALLSFDLSNLDFGAVDVIYNRKQNRAYVLEINTAPGLSGYSVEVYSNAFKRRLEENV